jgi:hypothetical protein
MDRNHSSISKKLNESFENQMTIYWSNLSRTTNLLIILNISMFFVTELVTKQGYYYTYYSLLLLLLVKVGLLFPFGLLNRLWYYCIHLTLVIVAVYLVVSSIWFWVVTNKI